VLVAARSKGCTEALAGRLLFSPASGMTKPEGNRCVVTWGRDGRGGSRGVYRSVAVGLYCKSHVDKVPDAHELNCTESDSSVSLTTGATESFVMFRFLQ